MPETRLPFEGRHLHDVLEVRAEPTVAEMAAGDWLLPLVALTIDSSWR